jgi:RNA polymerase sigma-70 factor, ECF subfamily
LKLFPSNPVVLYETMNTTQEKELVEKAKRDIQAFGTLYEEYYGKVFGYSLIRTGEIAVAQDITSEVFFKALKTIGRFHWKDIPFSAWLYHIANNEIANYYRSNGHGQVLVERISETFLEECDAPEAEVEEAETKLRRYQDFLAARQKIAQLPLKYQEVISLRFFENKHLGEISSILGKKESSVKTLLYRGLARLKTLLQQDNADGHEKEHSTEDLSYERIRIE